MSSSKICRPCLRALHKAVRAELKRSPLPLTSPISSTRHLSIHRRLLQNAQHARNPEEALVPPIINPTATANITTNAPPATPPTRTDDGTAPILSTAAMQKNITANLSRRRSLGEAMAQSIRHTKTAETYITYGVTESLFKTCSAQAEYDISKSQRASPISGAGPPKTAGGEDLGIPTESSRNSWWLNETGSTSTASSESDAYDASTSLALPPTFSTWSQVTYLHMYLLAVRIRALPSSTTVTNYNRYLLDHFSHSAEDKMILLHYITARGIRNRYLKDLFLQWRGILAAYDEGLVKGDAVLGSAVWRNLWKGQEDVDWVKVSMVVGYMRTALVLLDRVEVDQLVGQAGRVFSEAKTRTLQAGVVHSQGISQPFEQDVA